MNKVSPPPTTDECLAIFSQYVGACNFMSKSPAYPREWPLHGVEKTPHGCLAISHNEAGRHTIPFDYLSLVVKPISEISAHDVAECNRIYEGSSSGLVEAIITRKNPYFGEGSPVHTQGIIDYLRSLGYALPYGKWSVEELVEAGVFKLV